MFQFKMFITQLDKLVHFDILGAPSIKTYLINHNHNQEVYLKKCCSFPSSLHEGNVRQGSNPVSNSSKTFYRAYEIYKKMSRYKTKTFSYLARAVLGLPL